MSAGIGTITVGDKAHNAASAPLFVDRISFPGDGAYAANGSPFKALFQAAVGSPREPLAVIAGDCGGYVPVYDPSSGKLKLYYGNYDSSDGPLIEVAGTPDLSAVTFNLVVLSK